MKSLERVREEIMTKMAAFVERFVDCCASWPNGQQFYVAEHKALDFGRELARMALQGFVDAMGSGYCGRHHVGRDGVVRTHQTYAKKTYQMIVGPVTVRAAAFSSSRCSASRRKMPKLRFDSCEAELRQEPVAKQSVATRGIRLRSTPHLACPDAKDYNP